MTVQELIEQLQQFDKESSVFVANPNNVNDTGQATEVEFNGGLCGVLII